MHSLTLEDMASDGDQALQRIIPTRWSRSLHTAMGIFLTRYCAVRKVVRQLSEEGKEKEVWKARLAVLMGGTFIVFWARLLCVLHVVAVAQEELQRKDATWLVDGDRWPKRTSDRLEEFATEEVKTWAVRWAKRLLRHGLQVDDVVKQWADVKEFFKNTDNDPGVHVLKAVILQKTTFPAWHIFARMLLAITPTNAAVERLFSRLRQVLTDTRTRLSEDHAEEELVLLVDAEDWEEYPHYDDIVREYLAMRKRIAPEKKRKSRSDKGKPRKKKKKQASNSQDTSPSQSTQSSSSDSDSDSSQNNSKDTQSTSGSDHSETDES